MAVVVSPLGSIFSGHWELVKFIILGVNSFLLKILKSTKISIIFLQDKCAPIALLQIKSYMDTLIR